MIVLYVMSNGTPEENLRQIFRVFDINNDGKISVAELKRIVKDLFHLINDEQSETNQEIFVKSGNDKFQLYIWMFNFYNFSFF